MQITVARIAFVALLAASITHCGSSGGSGGGDPDPMGPDPAPSAVTVTTNLGPPAGRFIPASTSLAVGGTVTWTNTTPAPALHDLVATTSNWQLGRTLASGESFQTTLAQAGTYRYVCTIHDGMTGTIEVR